MYIRILRIFLVCSILPSIALGVFINSFYVGLFAAGFIVFLFAFMGTAFYFSLATTVEALKGVLESLTVESIVAATTVQPVQEEEEV
jgi:hypothetical protein